MRSLRILVVASLIIASFAVPRGGAQEASGDLVLVQGGGFKSTKSNFVGRVVAVSDFHIGRYEVTQNEWIELMGRNPSKFRGDDRPVETVSWYDCIEYCNRRSLKEGLAPYYAIDKGAKDPNNRTEIDDVKWTVTIDAGSKGYRLPTEAEWEYAASGGQRSKSFAFSGSDRVPDVAWFWENSGDEPLSGYWHWPTIEQNNNQTQPVGRKRPNELGLYDMSGNVREWCWDWYGELQVGRNSAAASSNESGRVWKGGGWLGADFCCSPLFRANMEASGKGPDQGFRICRSR